ncbi:MAG: 4-hydroxyphenylacetate 3-hydroxylase C-terminal domain-containing protein, partial [Actinomycetota bacterium]
MLEKHLRGAWPADRRLAILNLIGELTAGPYGDYQAVLAIHAESSIEAEKMAMLRAYDPERAMSLALRLAGITDPRTDASQSAGSPFRPTVRPGEGAERSRTHRARHPGRWHGRPLDLRGKARHPLRQNAAELVRRVLLEEVDASDGGLAMVGPAPGQRSLHRCQEPRVAMNEKLG